YLSKGQVVYIEGRIHYNSYEKEGVKRYTTDIIGSNMQMLSRRDDSTAPSDRKYDTAPPSTEPSPEPAEGDIEDDLPF
ncbi:MAG TPA: single-stranded DNA-binding protein, partial [Bacteroidetes bacterium]|nr:single-stranded DNA-binding protein [Bacteroidota bacterium]